LRGTAAWAIATTKRQATASTASALAFLVKLRQLPRGDLRLKQMLAHLTQHLNWQTAFLQAYKPIFHSLLEVEKWWALARIQFIGEGAAEAWPPQRGLDILGQLLSVTLSTRNAPGAPARRVPVSLQQAVRRLALADFVSVARLKQRQLAAVAARLPREVGLLGREYRILLERYLTAAHQASARTRRRERAFVVEGVRLTEEALRAGWQPELVLFTGDLSERGQAVVDGFRAMGAETLPVAPQVMTVASDTQTPQGILAVLPLPQPEIPIPLALETWPLALRTAGTPWTWRKPPGLLAPLPAARAGPPNQGFPFSFP